LGILFHLWGTGNLKLFDSLYHTSTQTKLFHCLTIHHSHMKMFENIYTPSRRLSLCLVGHETTRVKETILSLLAIAGTTCLHQRTIIFLYNSSELVSNFQTIVFGEAPPSGKELLLRASSFSFTQFISDRY
jgi:hypothetical protein